MPPFDAEVAENILHGLQYILVCTCPVNCTKQSPSKGQLISKANSKLFI